MLKTRASRGGVLKTPRAASTSHAPGRGGQVIVPNGTSGSYCGPGRPTVYGPETRRSALAMVREGVPKKDVARKLGVSLSTVKEWCRREGVKGAEREPDRLHEFPAWVKCRMAALGWTQQELSRRSGVHATTICNILVGRYGASLSVAVKIIDALEGAWASR